MRPHGRARAALGAGGGAVFALAAGNTVRRHLKTIAADPDHAQLSSPLRGRALRARSADGTTLNVEVFGPDQGTTIVLAPGWTEQLTFFDYMTRELVRHGVRVVVYDLRGQGRSDYAPRDDYSLARYGEDLEAVLEASCAGFADVVVAGHSLGAMSIAAWAEHHDTSRIRAAALMNTGVAGLIEAHRLYPVGAIPPVLQRGLARRAFLGNPLALPALSTPVSHAAIRYVAFGPHATPGQVAFYERMLMTCSPKVRAAVGIAMAEMDLLHALPRLAVPTLVLAGDDDRLTPPSHAYRIARALPQVDRVIVLAETGHMGPLERPIELSHALLGLADRVASHQLSLAA